MDTNALEAVCRFTFQPAGNIPEEALERASLLLIDTLGVGAGAASLEVGQIVRDYAFETMAAGIKAQQAAILFDGRIASQPGAAFALASQIDNLDAHDGFNPVKGHIGCAAVPALFACAAANRTLSARDALAALVVAYEIAARAGLALHDSVSDYHTSGAWNALGVAAMACRLTGSTKNQLRQALGIAEYHGPRSQMMREIANPTMLHDGSGMGAMIGLSAQLMAARGFTGAPAITVEGEDVAHHWKDLGLKWTILDNYIKPYPICRWAHAAIDGVRKLVRENEFTPGDITSIEIRTFHEASCLFPGVPTTTSQAQYSLPFAVSVMLVHGEISTRHVSDDGLNDKEVAALVPKVRMIEEARFSDRFPLTRMSEAEITLSDGRVLNSGEVHARGGTEEPMSIEELREKFESLASPNLGRERAMNIWSMGRELPKGDRKLSELTELLTAPAQFG